VLALGLHSSLAPRAITFTGFSLFLGVAMAITAFPVLARILTAAASNGRVSGPSPWPARRGRRDGLMPSRRLRRHRAD
jgi:hypothetical protein